MHTGSQKRPNRFLEESSLARHYLWKYRKWIGVGLCSLVVVDVIDILPPIFLKEVVDIAVQRRPLYLLARIAIAYLGISLIQGLCRYGWRMYLIRSSIFAGRDLRGRFAQHLFTLPMSFFDSSRMGDLMSLATNDVDAVRTAIGTGLLVFADALFYLLTIPVAMYMLSPRLTFLVCLPLPVIPWIVFRNEKKIHERLQKVQACFGKISSITQESLNGIRVVKAFAKEDTQIAKIREAGQEFIQLNLRLARIQSVIGPSLDLVMSFGMVILLLSGGESFIHSGELALSLGTFVAFQRYIQKMVWPMAALGMSINYYQRSVSSSLRLNEIFSVAPDVVKNPEPLFYKKAVGKIEFKHLSFHFPEGGSSILKDVSLSIDPGERVAFVGSIGSGKSVILSLIPRLYPIEKGMLMIDGIDINDWPLEALRKQVGYVSQEVFLFSETVFENVAFGLHELMVEQGSKKQIEESTGLASIHEEVARLSAAYGTRLGERGINLSGGQKQRLTLARALAKQPSILVLDDALSSVDVQTEGKILNNLRSRPGRNTELIAAHRISTVKDADRIIVLSQGKISQVGTHSKLISQRGGEYWKFYEQQRLKEDLENYENELC